MTDIPETQRQQGERGRLGTKGRRTDDGSWATLLVVHDADGSWTFHGPSAPVVTLSRLDMIALVESILARA